MIVYNVGHAYIIILFMVTFKSVMLTEKCSDEVILLQENNIERRVSSPGEKYLGPKPSFFKSLVHDVVHDIKIPSQSLAVNKPMSKTEEMWRKNLNENELKTGTLTIPSGLRRIESKAIRFYDNPVFTGKTE